MFIGTEIVMTCFTKQREDNQGSKGDGPVVLTVNQQSRHTNKRLLGLSIPVENTDDIQVVLQLFKVGQVHDILADRRIFMESLGWLTCLYARVGNPCTLEAACPSAYPTVPLCGTQWGVPTLLNTRKKQSQQRTKTGSIT